MSTDKTWKNENRKIAVLVDNDSWILPYAKSLVKEINKTGDKAKLYRKHEDLTEGFICFFLGCTKIASQKTLDKHVYNLVVHESSLPEGRGFAPITWQILEGRSEIDFCLIEAADEADAGDIYLKKRVKFNGYELCDEIRDIQGKTTVEMALEFLKNKKEPFPTIQTGEPTMYRKRTPEDSRLDINKTIAEQFQLLRVVDNERYPAFFEIDGHEYEVKITKKY